MSDISNFHKSFYKRPDRQFQNEFILRFVEVKNVKRRRSRANKTKEKPQLMRTTKYFVRNRSGEKVPVCMNAFISILDVSRFRVNKITKDFKQTGETVEKRGGFRKADKYNKQKRSVMNFINSFKCLESHYCRGNSCRKYLPSELSVRKMWRIYSSKTGNIPVKISFFRKVFNTEYNVGFGTPRTDVCSTCLNLKELIKTEKDEKKKLDYMTEKRIHRLQYEAFYSKLKDRDEETLILSFDCQKNLPLPKIPDQSTYYSRQFYFQNFTIVKGHSKSPLNSSNVTSYCWTENEFSKDSNLISSCVFDCLRSIDMSPYKRIRLVSDGCGGQNKNSTLVAMCHAWLGCFAPTNIEEMQLIFPITGHSFLPADRVFGIIERKLKKTEEIVKPDAIIDIISEHSSVKRVGTDCEVADFRTVARTFFKDLKQWNFQISSSKRIHFTKGRQNFLVYTRGENTYRTDLGKKQILTKKGILASQLNPDIIEKRNSISAEKKKDVEKLLVNHFGPSWKENEALQFYKDVIDGVPDIPIPQEQICEVVERPPILQI